MDSFILGPGLALGIPVLDQSNRIVFELLERMQDLPRPEFDQACKRLASELAEDLAEENQLMRAINYAAAEAHEEAHVGLLDAVEHAQSLLVRGDLVNSRAIIRSLSNWIEAHINTMDLALAIAITRSK